MLATESEAMPWTTTYLPFSTPARLYLSSTYARSFLEMDTRSGGVGCRGTSFAGRPIHSSISSYMLYPPSARLVVGGLNISLRNSPAPALLTLGYT
uniref:Uncharacterized protein n=1 Tax=Arundo donax TaxID=35708 RepID=A0A0A9ERW5_ARUDO